MTTRAPHQKAKNAELELAKLLDERLGFRVRRNLEQCRQGGHDLLIPGWALEVKRHAELRRNVWWQQAVAQAEAAGQRPALAYRANHQPWKFMVALCDLAPAYAAQSIWLTAELDLEGFCLVIRESMPLIDPAAIPPIHNLQATENDIPLEATA